MPRTVLCNTASAFWKHKRRPEQLENKQVWSSHKESLKSFRKGMKRNETNKSAKMLQETGFMFRLVAGTECDGRSARKEQGARSSGQVSKRLSSKETLDCSSPEKVLGAWTLFLLKQRYQRLGYLIMYCFNVCYTLKHGFEQVETRASKPTETIACLSKANSTCVQNWRAVKQDDCPPKSQPKVQKVSWSYMTSGKVAGWFAYSLTTWERTMGLERNLKTSGRCRRQRLKESAHRTWSLWSPNLEAGCHEVPWGAVNFCPVFFKHQAFKCNLLWTRVAIKLCRVMFLGKRTTNASCGSGFCHIFCLFPPGASRPNQWPPSFREPWPDCGTCRKGRPAWRDRGHTHWGSNSLNMVEPIWTQLHSCRML